jgi:hypothetical protein
VIEVFLGSHFGRVAVGDLIKNRMLGQHAEASFLAVLIGQFDHLLDDNWDVDARWRFT